MGSPEFYSIRDLAHPRVHTEWHEAIAVAAEVGDTLVAQGRDQLPDLVGFGITGEGSPAFSDNGGATDSAVRQLGRALELLFTAGEAPGPARDLATLAAKAPDGERVDQFVGALRYYERPDRPDILHQLASRASLVHAELTSEAELGRLQERAREHAQQQREERKPEPAGESRRRTWRWASIGAAVLVLSGGAALMFLPSTRGVILGPIDRYFAPSAIEPRPLPADAPSTGRNSPQAAGPATSPQDAAPFDVTSGATAALDRDVNSGSPPADSSRRGDAGARGMLFTVISEGPGAPVPPELGGDGGLPVYTAAAPGITPPVLLRQQLPSEPPPGVSPEDMGTFVLLIDQTGSVERVHLVSPSNRFQERMLVAAAKAWKFKPAVLHGTPVRYRMHVRITW